MSTITTSASANTSILASDLGNCKCVACVHDAATGELDFTTFKTTRTELRSPLLSVAPRNQRAPIAKSFDLVVT